MAKKYNFSENMAEKRINLLQSVIASARNRANKARLVRLSNLYELSSKTESAGLCLEISKQIYEAESSGKEFL